MYELSAVCGDTVEYPSLLTLTFVRRRTASEKRYSTGFRAISLAAVSEPFAGSGILSFEALSRGAALVTLSETVPEVVSSLKAEADKLGALAAACDIRLADGYAVLKAPPPLTDLVFLDPPFAEARFEELFEALSGEERYPAHLLVYVESAAPLPESSYASFGFEPIKQKQAGQVTFALFARCA